MGPSSRNASHHQLTHLLILIAWALLLLDNNNNNTKSTLLTLLVPPSLFVSADSGTSGYFRPDNRRQRILFGSMAAASASDDGSSQTSVIPRRRLTLSGGGVPEINAAVSSDETEVLEIKALELARGGAEAAAAEGVVLHRQHMISSLVAGMGSGVLASVVCAPLDLIRTRMQVMASTRGHNMPSLSVYRNLADIVKQDGIRGCFRGLGATLATVPAFWGLYFPLYEHLKKDFHHRYDRCRGLKDAPGTGPCPPLVHCGAAMAAGAAADIVCNPLFLVRTRIQTEALHYFERPPSERVPHGVLKTVKAVYAEGGIPAFWRGLTASLLGLGHVAIQFPVYEYLKSEARRNSTRGEESPADLLLASGVSKMCASLLTYPHEVIRSRMMDARGADAGMGAIRTIGRIVNSEGFGGLYAGIHVSLLRVVPNCCITFMSYELILRYAKEQMRR